jgi:transposase
MNRKPYPSDISDEEWSFIAPYLTLMVEDAPQRTHDLREVFNALRWIVRTGAPWRMMPTNFPESVNHNPQQPSSTVAPCAALPKVVIVLNTMGINARKGARFISRSIL